MNCPVVCAQDIAHLMPNSIAEIDKNIAQVKKQLLADVQEIIAIDAKKRTFENTVFAIDNISRKFSLVTSPIHLITMVHADKTLRDYAQNAIVALQPFIQEELARNQKLFSVFKAYYDGNAHTQKLTTEERYFLDESMRDFKRAGLLLPPEQLEQVRKLSNELADLGMQFERNINQDETTLTFDAAQLRGVPESIVQALEINASKQYVVRMVPPVVFAILEHAHQESTRKAVSQAFRNRAYPQNYALLKQIIAKRHELAQLLGYKTYAHLELENEMIRSPEYAHQFLNELIDRAAQAQKNVFLKITRELPESVTLTSDGLIKPWDAAYLKEWYKQKHLNVDDKLVRQYFPVEHVISQVMDIYQTFFGLKFETVNVENLWDSQVKCLAIYKQTTHQLIGFLLLDLYPRPGKFTHACMIDLIAGQKYKDCPCPSVTCIIANFLQKSAKTPALLPFADVCTFFHEFGHAMHAAVGITPFYGSAGIHTKIDFVETPSQLMEKWPEDIDILRRLSKHYQTGQSLPEEVIKQLVTIKKFNAGDFVRSQAGFALLSLELFEGPKHDIDQLLKQITQRTLPQISFDDNTHMPAGSGHLIDYGPIYYGYLWSDVIAHDLFQYIKKQGLLNAQIGQELIDKVLSKGGSVHPENLIIDFLGRKPNQDAFIQDLGLNT